MQCFVTLSPLMWGMVDNFFFFPSLMWHVFVTFPDGSPNTMAEILAKNLNITQTFSFILEEFEIMPSRIYFTLVIHEQMSSYRGMLFLYALVIFLEVGTDWRFWQGKFEHI